MRPMDSDWRPLDWQFDPLEAMRRWPRDRRVLMLHSGRLDPKWARWSILAEPVGTYQFLDAARTASGLITDTNPPCGLSRWLGPADVRPVDQFTHNPFSDLRALLNSTNGLLIGYLGYDLRRWIERLPTNTGSPRDDRNWPIIELGYCPGYLVHDALTNHWSARGTWAHHAHPPYPDLSRPRPRHYEVAASNLRSGFTRTGYERCVSMVKDYIAAGDVFQVNLAQRFTAGLAPRDGMGSLNVPGNSFRAAGQSRALYHRLAAASPAWYGAYLELAPDSHDSSDRAIASTSPELFLHVTGRDVMTRPIKGTRPASANPAELRGSLKDTAELNMIIDLMRNDLGRVCDYGSVRVTGPRTIESHPTVHHGVATIEGRLHESKDIVDLLRATIPGGSVTGAPKVRAMQIIDELEPVRRGPYCGCIGYLSRDSAQLSIAIRTMLIDTLARRVDFSVGGGVVADSQPAAEYQETLDKAAAMLTALGIEDFASTQGCEVHLAGQTALRPVGL